MNYKFPQIEHIDQALAAIEGRDEFIVKRTDDYTVINYIVQLENTFPPVTGEATAILRECRGLIFDKEGKVISRPFHKFFNVNERDETRVTAADLSGWHFLEKLDGSMVRPIPIGDHYRLGTKMGVTDVAMNAETFVANHSSYDRFIRAMIRAELTPIFEWCSNKNRIVINYPNDRLVLTGLRDNETGKYINFETINHNADEQHRVEVVRSFDFTDLDSAVEYLKTVEDFEGFVIRNVDGHMLKVKGDWYLQLHKTKDAIRFEKDVIRLFCDNQFDDLKPLLLEHDLNRLTKFHERFWSEVKLTAFRLMEEFNHNIGKYDNRRDFAVEFANKKDQWFRPFMYEFFNATERPIPLGMAEQSVIDAIRKGTSSSTAVENVRHLFNIKLDDYNE